MNLKNLVFLRRFCVLRWGFARARRAKTKQLVMILVACQLLSACAEKTVGRSTSKPASTPETAPNASVRAKSNPGARVFITEPKNGATVSSPVTVKFGVEGISLEKAGEVKDNSGHHHIAIDAAELPPLDQPLPFSDTLIHFGQAQTEASVNLSPGSHTLQLIFAGGNHIQHDPPVVSEKITITVR